MVGELSELKARAEDWLRRVADNRQTVVITRDGKRAGVLLSPAAYDELTERCRFVGAIVQGLADMQAGRVCSHEQVSRELRNRRDTND